MADRVRVAVVGATGYSGAELCVLLARHPRVELVRVCSSAERKESVPFSSLHASLRGVAGPACEPFALERLAEGRPDLVLLATPNETSAAIAGLILETGARVVDLSGAFRSRDAETHEAWYGFAHPRATLLAQAVYALPELMTDRAAMRNAKLIANPGCYATSMILALAPIAPLLHKTEAVIADCKSGVSGAGKRAELAYSFTELSANFKTYSTNGHRHEPEVRRALGWSDAQPFEFVPHLLPVARGILSTLHVPLAKAEDAERITALYAAAYANARFVGVRPHGELPSLSDVVGTPRCEIGFQVLRGGRRLLVVSVLDNLLKGAASQAVQNLNLAFGFDEAEGLN